MTQKQQQYFHTVLFFVPDEGLTFFFTMTGSSLVSKSFLFFLSGLSSSLGRGGPSRDSKGGRFFGGSSSFLLGISSRSAFLFTADVDVKAVTVAVATMGGSGSSFGSRFKRGSFSSEPGRFDAYLKPGPLFCFEAKRLEKREHNFILLVLRPWYISLFSFLFCFMLFYVFTLIQYKAHTDAYFPCFPSMVALWALPAVWQFIVDDSIWIFYLIKKKHIETI